MARRASVRRISVLEPIEEISHDSFKDTIVEPRCVSVGYAVNVPINLRPRARRFSVDCDASHNIYRQSLIVEPTTNHYIQNEPFQSEPFQREPFQSEPFQSNSFQSQKSRGHTQGKVGEQRNERQVATQSYGQISADQSFFEARQVLIQHRQSMRRESVTKFHNSLEATIYPQRRRQSNSGQIASKSNSNYAPLGTQCQENRQPVARPAANKQPKAKQPDRQPQSKTKKPMKQQSKPGKASDDEDYSRLPSYARPTAASKARAAAVQERTRKR